MTNLDRIYFVTSFPLRAALTIVAGACLLTGVTVFMVVSALAGAGDVKE